MKPNLLFLTLKIFSATGGIEKVSRIAGKALYELAGGASVSIYSAYDSDTDLDPKYFSASVFKGFSGSRASFVLQSLKKASGATVVVLSHVNLLTVGFAIKQLYPKTKLVLLAHGIEVWHPVPGWKMTMLRACDLVLPVSRFTREKMISLYGLDPAKLEVINNCLDPFLQLPAKERTNVDTLLARYGLTAANKILFTLTRLSFKERYKGYDEVMMAVKRLKKNEPGIRYLIAGKYDKLEKDRLDALVHQQGLEDKVIFAGYIPDSELAAHFEMADMYIMPSRKEGFGIVFIEALYYGLPVIAGNLDGSVDALADGRMGLLVNPDRPNEIRAALAAQLKAGRTAVPSQEEVVRRFGFDTYKEKLRAALGISSTPEIPARPVVLAGTATA